MSLIASVSQIATTSFGIKQDVEDTLQVLRDLQGQYESDHSQNDQHADEQSKPVITPGHMANHHDHQRPGKGNYSGEHLEENQSARQSFQFNA